MVCKVYEERTGENGENLTLSCVLNDNNVPMLNFQMRLIIIFIALILGDICPRVYDEI